MSHTHTHPRKRLLAGVLAIALACLGLAACGSSGSSSTSTTNAANTSTTTSGTAPGAPGARNGRFAAMRACLQKGRHYAPHSSPGSVTDARCRRIPRRRAGPQAAQGRDSRAVASGAEEVRWRTRALPGRVRGALTARRCAPRWPPSRCVCARTGLPCRRPIPRATDRCSTPRESTPRAPPSSRGQGQVPEQAERRLRATRRGTRRIGSLPHPGDRGGDAGVTSLTDVHAAPTGRLAYSSEPLSEALPLGGSACEPRSRLLAAAWGSRIAAELGLLVIVRLLQRADASSTS